MQAVLKIWGWACDSAFLTSSQEMPVLPVENHPLSKNTSRHSPAHFSLIIVSLSLFFFFFFSLTSLNLTLFWKWVLKLPITQEIQCMLRKVNFEFELATEPPKLCPWCLGRQPCILGLCSGVDTGSGFLQ